MKNKLFFVVSNIFLLGFCSGCLNTNVSSFHSDDISLESSSQSEQLSSSSSESTSSSESKNNLHGTFNRPYASYYEPGVPLLDDAYVIYMNFDGFARYYFDAYLADTELSKDSTFRQLMTEGVFFDEFRNSLPSITNPCQNQILSGATTAITKNVYRYYNKSQDVVVQQARENASKILPQLTVENNITTASVAHYLAEAYLTETDTSKLYITKDITDPAVAGTALEGSYLDRFNQLIKLVKGVPLKTYGNTITVKDFPHFTMFYIDDLDALGHNEVNNYGMTRASTEVGRMKNILQRLREIDDKMGELVAACKERGIYDKLTFFLTTDHGMTPFGVQSENDPINYGKSKFGELCNDIKTFNKNYTVELVGADKSPSSNTTVVAVGSNLNVQLTWKNGITESQMQSLKTYLLTKNYVAKVFTKAELAEMGYWTAAADMIITPAKYYCFSGQVLATYSARAQHDSSLDEASKIFGLAWGNGLKKNYKFEETAYNYDFGVTMAACLGLTLPNANGIVLDIFDKD